MDRTLARYVTAVRALERLTGLSVVWKDATGSGPEAPDHPLHLHRNPFCMAVKDNPRRLLRCTHEDNELTAARAARSRAAFVRTCHAGVTELVVPVFDAGRFDGLLFMGPMRRRGARCPYPHARRVLDALPPFERSRLETARPLLALLAEALETHKARARLAERHDRATDPRVRSAMAFVDEHLSGRIATEDVARHCHLSVSRLLHLFKETTGGTLGAYVTAARVARAKALLAHTRLRIVDIAPEVGYQNQNYFATVFRRSTGMTAREYRSRARTCDEA